MKTVQERLETILREQLGLNNDDEILPKSPITELGADSLDAVEVVMAIEEEFDIDISDDDFQGLDPAMMTLESMTEVVSAKTNG